MRPRRHICVAAAFNQLGAPTLCRHLRIVPTLIPIICWRFDVLKIAMLTHEYELRFELLEAVPADAEMVLLDTFKSRIEQVRQLQPTDLRQIPRIWRRSGIPLLHRLAAARIRSRGVSLILATDRHVEFWNDIAVLCPDVRQILVGHGVLTPVVRKRLSLTLPFENRVLCVWSERERELVHHYANGMLRVVTLGSVRNACYQYSRCLPATGGEAGGPEFLCLVSSFSGTKKELQRQNLGDPRAELRSHLISVALEISRESGWRIVVAMKPETMSEFSEGRLRRMQNEMEYFADALRGISVTFTDPNHRFSTYACVDSAVLTLGIFSSPIVEGFGRFRNVYSVGPDRTRAEFGSLPDLAHIDLDRLADGKALVERALLAKNDDALLENQRKTRYEFLEDGRSTRPLDRLRNLVRNGDLLQD